MTKRERSLFAGMTDYTAVPMDAILAHLRNWRDGTADCIEKLSTFQSKVEQCKDRLEGSEEVLGYIAYFVDLLSRYHGDFERLLTEMPSTVSEAHVQIVEQIYESASREERNCVAFKQDHIEHGLEDEGLRWLVDGIYSESRGMLIDYQDLSNLVPRLRTFVGATPNISRELEQKFRILYSPSQEQLDFDLWMAEAQGVSGYSIGVIFLDVDDFKRLNTSFTEAVVDRAILPPLQLLVRDLCTHRGGAYRHGGEELLVILPNYSLAETTTFAEKLRGEIETKEFRIDDHPSQRLTISAGVAVWPNHGHSLERVIESANRAEREAKKAGKNRVHTAPQS